MKNNVSESVPKEEGFRLELVDTITVPQWLYDAYVMGKDYDGNLTFTEQEKLADFREKYGSYHLDNHDEEAQYHGTNEFDGMGGLCYDVDVYKRSSDESKKNESKKDEDTADYGTENPKGFAELTRRLEADGFSTYFSDKYGDTLSILKGDKSWIVEYNSGFERDPEEPWDLFIEGEGGEEYIGGFESIPDLIDRLKEIASGKAESKKDEAFRQDFDIDCESCIQALDEMKKKVLEWKKQGYDGVDDPNEVSLLCRALRDVESKFEIR